jgi:hypothetical protein
VNLNGSFQACHLTTRLHYDEKVKLLFYQMCNRVFKDRVFTKFEINNFFIFKLYVLKLLNQKTRYHV